MVFCRKGACLTCGCRVEIQRYESLAKVLRRIDEMTGCPNCGCTMAWQDTDVPVGSTIQVLQKRAKC